MNLNKDLLDLMTKNYDICNFIRVGITSTYLYFNDFACSLDVSPAITNRFWLLSLVALVNNGP